MGSRESKHGSLISSTDHSRRIRPVLIQDNQDSFLASKVGVTMGMEVWLWGT